MIERTIQEWSNFLGLKIICFKLGTNTYKYIGIDTEYIPFSTKWSEYLGDIIQTDEPEEFYKNNKWNLTKILAKDSYDSLFIPDENGNLYCLKLNNNKHIYVKGKLEDPIKGFIIPIECSKWDKTIYEPEKKKVK